MAGRQHTTTAEPSSRPTIDCSCRDCCCRYSMAVAASSMPNHAIAVSSPRSAPGRCTCLWKLEKEAPPGDFGVAQDLPLRATIDAWPSSLSSSVKIGAVLLPSSPSATAKSTTSSARSPQTTTSAIHVANLRHLYLYSGLLITTDQNTL